MLDTDEIKLFDPDGGPQPDATGSGNGDGAPAASAAGASRLAAHEYAGNAFQAA